MTVKKKPSEAGQDTVVLKGWQRIAEFLGEPVSVAERWASDGMPVSHQGRFVTAVPEELDRWLGRDTGKPVHLVTSETDLVAELKRGLSFVRGGQAAKSPKSRKS